VLQVELPGQLTEETWLWLEARREACHGIMHFMSDGHFAREVENRLHRVADSSALARQVLVEEIFDGDFDDEELLRLVAEIFQGIDEIFMVLAHEIDGLGDQLSDIS